MSYFIVEILIAGVVIGGVWLVTKLMSQKDADKQKGGKHDDWQDF